MWLLHQKAEISVPTSLCLLSWAVFLAFVAYLFLVFICDFAILPHAKLKRF